MDLRGVEIGVANRGIPALRIGRTIREMGGLYVAFYTEVDKTAPHVTKADRAFPLRGERGYLEIDEIIDIARRNGIRALHPGWGFAAEHPRFPRACWEAGIVFIGPSEGPMRALGNKLAARALARRLGIPVIPGSDRPLELEEARQVAAELGYPVMLKSEGGGGGRGIFLVRSERELVEAFPKAAAMAEASFGNPRLYLEKFLPWAKHLEIQVIRDRYGNALAFDERDCSVQRKHQKLLEVTPTPWPGMTPELRARLKEAALRLLAAADYDSLGTVEFLVDPQGNFYLLEVNTRLQVEHGITELRYGIDLVEEMIRVAFGEPLRWREEDLVPRGYALQCRINFEDPQRDFQPNAGKIVRYLSPGGEGVRLDSCVFGGYEFPRAYDSAGALLMACGATWEKALSIMQRALSEYVIGGLKTTIPFHRRVIAHPTFRRGEADTRFVERTPELTEYRELEPEHIRLSYLVAEITARGYNPWLGLGPYRRFGDSRLGPLEVSLPEPPPERQPYRPPFDPQATRAEFLRQVRSSPYVELCNTTPRDATQSDSNNRLRLHDDRLYGPLLDRCGYVSLETGGGAHYHVAMIGCMTDPWHEAAEWNRFAPHTRKQILVRSTNLLGYAPQPRAVMERTGRLILQHYHIVRCFDFLNHVENMEPLARLVLSSDRHVFQPAISLSWAEGFTVEHYLGVLEEILAMVGRVLGCDRQHASREIILCLKDMAGVCPPSFIRDLVSAILDRYPDLIVQYHRHATDGLALPALGAAAQAGAKILDVADGAAVRFYGQPPVLSVAAYLGELGLRVRVDLERVREVNFVLKQIMPFYDRYCRPFFLGVDYDVVRHGLPGGATSSSQEAAFKQGHAFLLPYILTILELYRKLIRYHDVTPGSQITWTNGYLMAVKAYERGGLPEVRRIIRLLREVTSKPEEALSEEVKAERLVLFRDANDSLKALLLGKYGRLPLGWPPDWVYQSVFGEQWREAIAQRTEESPLRRLPDPDVEAVRQELARLIGRQPTEEELVNYLNHPSDALQLIELLERFGDPNNLPDDLWFEGMEEGQEREFVTSDGKVHTLRVISIGEVDEEGRREVRYLLDQELFVWSVQVERPRGRASEVEMADPHNPYHIAAPFDADLWIVHKRPGDRVRKGEEVLNLSLMKMECAVTSPVDGVVRRVVVFADYRADRKMVPVRKGQLLMELAPLKRTCPQCEAALEEEFHYCPYCGHRVELLTPVDTASG